MQMLQADRKSKWFRNVGPALCLLLAGFGAIALAGYPIYVIRPFREQAPASLQHALWVLLHFKPLLVMIAVFVTAFAVLAWRRSGWIAKSMLVPSIGLVVLAAVSAWINPYEHMFHPFGEPRYVSIQQAALDPGDMVIVVTVAGESRAYPIREMGYHHVVNDRLHELPIVVTY